MIVLSPFHRPSTSSENTKNSKVRRGSGDSNSRPTSAGLSFTSPRKVSPMVLDQPTEDIAEQFLERKRRLSLIAEGSVFNQKENINEVNSPSKPWETKQTKSTTIASADEGKSKGQPATKTTFHKIAKFQFLDFSANAKVSVGKTVGEWREEVHGGVKMWVNIKTNEVSVRNPFEPDKRKFEENGTFRVKTGPIPKGTAANLYDQSAVSEMFRILDA